MAEVKRIGKATADKIAVELEKNSDKRLYGLWSLACHDIRLASNNIDEQFLINLFAFDPIAYKVLVPIVRANVPVYVKSVDRVQFNWLSKSDDAWLILACASMFAAVFAKTDEGRTLYVCKLCK